VAVPAASPIAMRTLGTLTVRVTRQDQPPLGRAGVDPAERGRGEGYKQPWMLADRLGDALATLEPGGQELVGVGPVGGRTRRAARLSPGAARLEQDPIRLPVAVVDLPNLAGAPVGVVDAAGALHDLLEDLGQQLADLDRLSGHRPPPSGGILAVGSRWPGRP
jgi:hypothetical protein